MGALFVGCAEQPKNPFSTDINSLDLTKDTITVNVPFPMSFDQARNLWVPTTGFGTATLQTQSPVSFADLAYIQMITIDSNGARHAVGIATDQDHGSSSQPFYIHQIDSVNSGDRIWLTDPLNSRQYLCNIEFRQNPTISVTIDLFSNGSESLNQMINTQNGLPPSMPFYIHFLRKN